MHTHTKKCHVTFKKLCKGTNIYLGFITAICSQQMLSTLKILQWKVLQAFQSAVWSLMQHRTNTQASLQEDLASNPSVQDLLATVSKLLKAATSLFTVC